MILRYTICEMRDSYSGSVWRGIHKYRYITIIVLGRFASRCELNLKNMLQTNYIYIYLGDDMQ